MKRHLLLLILGLYCSLGNVSAQSDDINVQTRVKTSITGARYEILQEGIYSNWLIDKHKGRVWLYYYLENYTMYASYKQLPLEQYNEQLAKIDTTQINYQGYLNEASPGKELLLLNIHTGEVWVFSPNKKGEIVSGKLLHHE